MNIFWKWFVRLHVWMYRQTGGKFGSEMRGFKVLILNTVGRKSGNIHSTTVGYFERDGGYMIVASNAGLPTHPAWFHNLKANPNFTIQVKDKVLNIHAEILSGAERDSAWKWLMETAPAFGDYQKNTTREIPLVLLRVNPPGSR